MEKQEKIETKNNSEIDLMDKASALMRAGHEFIVQRNEKNLETAEVRPGKLQYGWKIMNVDRENKLVNMYRGVGTPEIFHISLKKLRDLNPEAFDIAAEASKK